MPPTTVYYTTYPSKPAHESESKEDDELSSPTSVLAGVPGLVGKDILEHMSLDDAGRPRKMQKREDEWVCPVSAQASRQAPSVKDSIQPIIDEIRPGYQRSDGKDPISLAAADPALPHLPPCTKAMEAVVQAALYKPHAAGYTNASGTPEARRAIAMHHSYPERQLGPDHVIVTNGCSAALDIALTSLLDAGTTLLVPQPGFPLYEEIASSRGVNVVRYRLDPTRKWECDLHHLEEIMAHKSNVRALVINNPSSHGSVFSENHLKQILDFALQHRLPIVSDEVYGNLTFGSNRFHPMAQIAARYGSRVPVITASGLSKQLMVPGWRVGWATFQDNIHGSMRQVEQGAHRLSQTTHGVSRLTQVAIPTLLSPSTPGLADWKEKFRLALERQGMLLCSSLNDCHCLKVTPPQGAMYAIVQVHCHYLDETIQNDMDFALKLVQEENVFVLPGCSFGAPDTVRVAFSASEDMLDRASQRIADFCRRHSMHGTSSRSVVGV